jgi:hypothetical protein
VGQSTLSTRHSEINGNAENQDNKNLDNFGLSDSQASNSNLKVSSRPSTSDLNTVRSFTEKSLYHASLFEIDPFPKAEALKEDCRVGAVLNGSPEKISLEAQVEVRLSQLNVTGYLAIARRCHENLSN